MRSINMVRIRFACVYSLFEVADLSDVHAVFKRKHKHHQQSEPHVQGTISMCMNSTTRVCGVLCSFGLRLSSADQFVEPSLSSADQFVER